MTEQHITANNLQICYEEFGEKQNPAIILISPLGSQMTSWPDEICTLLANKGFRVVRFDNRDVGLSERIEYNKTINLFILSIKSTFGLPSSTPYSLLDMAKDALGLIDALGIEKAHWVGMSMGGMIAQLLASHYPERTLSLTSIMSSSGRRSLPKPSPKILKQIMVRPNTADKESYIQHVMRTWELIGSPAYPINQEDLRKQVERSLKRSTSPKGYRNQVAAIMTSGDRRIALRRIKCPTLIIHGKADVLAPVACGIDTAKNITGAQLELFDGMGHDLPKELIPKFVGLIHEITTNN